MRRADPRREQVAHGEQRRRGPLPDDRCLLSQREPHLLGGGLVTVDGAGALDRPARQDVGADGDPDLPATRTTLPNGPLPMSTHEPTMGPRKSRLQG